MSEILLHLKVQMNNRFLERNVRRIPETIQTGTSRHGKTKGL
jgi:hypothetical protein